jgi:hypothetical protein|tara:strand:- start:274 stop:843 length:570 start_codon:yes stop_codon:yes gene_type:complete
MAYKQKGWLPFNKKSKKLKKAEQELDARKEAYASLDTSNPYDHMDNPYEDLKVSLLEMDARKNKHEQDTANALDALRETQGGSGAAELANTLAFENKIMAQEMAADVGKQESENNKRNAEFKARIQELKAEGEIMSRQSNMDKNETLLGMSQQELAAQREIEAESERARVKAIQDGITGITGVINNQNS